MPHARSAGQEGHCEHSAWLMCSTTYFEPMLRHGTGWNTRFSTGFVHFGVPDWGIWGNDISSDSSKKTRKPALCRLQAYMFVHLQNMCVCKQQTSKINVYIETNVRGRPLKYICVCLIHQNYSSHSVYLLVPNAGNEGMIHNH